MRSRSFKFFLLFLMFLFFLVVTNVRAQMITTSSQNALSFQNFSYENETVEPFQELPPEVIKNLPPDINEQVAYFIKYYTTRGRRGLQKWFKRCGMFLPYFKAIFKEFGIPEDLVYLAIIESG